MQKTLNIIAKISVIVLLYILVYYTFFAFISKPKEGDSLDYHIPIARMIINGSYLNVNILSRVNPMRYSPGSSEAILSLFILFHLPLNLYNVVALIILFAVLYVLGRKFGLERNYSVIFAVSFCTLHGVDRWLSAQTIDIWLAIFFSLTLILIQNPESKISFFLKLGFTSGMLIGTKFTGPIFFLILFIFYAKQILRNLNIQRFVAFLLPFVLLGLFWYIRNYIFTHDPYYPQSIPFFKGREWHIFDWAVWKIIFLYPSGFTGTLNAFFSEYTIWTLSLPLSIFFIFYSWMTKQVIKHAEIIKLTTIGLANFAVYFFMPSGPHDNLMVTGFRYTYPAFIPLILSVFLVAKIYKKQELLSVISIINMIMLTELDFHPKILIVLIPIGLIIYFFDISKLKKLPVQLLYQKKK